MAKEDVKVSLNLAVNSIGMLAQASISDESKFRIVTSDCGPTNEIVVRARITGQQDWDVLATITGNSKQAITVKTYDDVQLECTVFDAVATFIKLAAGSFNDAGGSTNIDAPTGGIIEEPELLTFTSSDSSVTIVTDPINNTIDFVASGAGSPFTKYVKTVLIGDWIGPSAGEYTLTIPFSFHGVTNPMVASYEENAGSFDLIIYPVNVDASHNVIIKANQTPDTRFLGKIVIE
jgi:hypothetical protein